MVHSEQTMPVPLLPAQRVAAQVQDTQPRKGLEVKQVFPVAEPVSADVQFGKRGEVL